MSLHIVLKNQGFHRRLSFQDSGRSYELAKKNKESTWQKTYILRLDAAYFFRTSVSSRLERHQKTKLYIYRLNGWYQRSENAINLPGARACLFCGFGCLELSEGNNDSSHYVEKTLLNFLTPRMMYPFRKRFVFQHDNAPLHTAQISKIWLQQKNIQTIDWPPYSACLTPIKNFWGFSRKKMVRDCPQTPKELTAYLHTWWCDLEITYTEKLVHSMFKRCDNVMQKVLDFLIKLFVQCLLVDQVLETCCTWNSCHCSK